MHLLTGVSLEFCWSHSSLQYQTVCIVHAIGVKLVFIHQEL